MKKIFLFLLLLIGIDSNLLAYSMSVNDGVKMVADNVAVRDTKSTNGTNLGRLPLGTTGTVIEGPDESNSYIWAKVRWDNGVEGWTPNSKTKYYYYEQPTTYSPGKPNETYEEITDLSPTLRWKKIDGVVKYRLALRDVETNELLVDVDIDGNLVSYTYPYELTENHRYYWDIAPRDADGDMGLWSESRYFKIKNETNTNKPDLKVEAKYIEIRPSSGVKAGDEFSVKLSRIYNVGQEKSDRYGIRFLYGGTDNSDSSFVRFDGDSYFQALDPGEQGKVVYSKEITTINTKGTHWVKVCVYDNPSDSSHDNDCAIKSFEVLEGDNDSNKPEITTISPTSATGSLYEKEIVITGDNLLGAVVEFSFDNGEFSTTVAPNKILEHTNSKIKFKMSLFALEDKLKKYRFRVKKNEGTSNIKTINVTYVPLAPLLFSGVKELSVNSGHSFTLPFSAVDIEDLINGINDYKLYVQWGKDATFYYQTKQYGEATRSFTFNSSRNKVFTVSAYAVDSSGQKSNMVQIKVNVKGSNDSRQIEKQVYANSTHKKVAKQSPCNSNSNSVNNSVDTATGAEHFEITPMVVHGIMDLPLTLKYNSILLDGMDIGAGWSHNYSIVSYIERLDNEQFGRVRIHWDNSNKKYNDFQYNGSYYESTDLMVQNDRLYLDASSDTFYLERKDGSIYYYDLDKKLYKIQNKIGQIINIVYYSDGKLKKVEEPVSGQYLKYLYGDTDGKLSEVIDKNGRATLFFYNNEGQLEEIKSPGENFIKYKFEYNQQNQLYKYTYEDSDNNQVPYFTLSYDDTGRVVREYDGNGNEANYYYDTTKTADRIHSLYTNKAGKTTKTIYDDANFTPYERTFSDGSKEYYEYYSNGKQKNFIDRAGNYTRYYYDTRGNLNRVKYQNGSEEKYTFDNNRNIIFKKIYDRNSQLRAVTHNTYNSDNTLSQTELPDGTVVSYSYNSNKQMISKTINGMVTVYKYDTEGYLIEETTPEGVKTSFTYDNVGRLKTKTVDGHGALTYEYDDMDHLHSITNELGNSRVFKYDFLGRKIEEIDFNANKTTYADDNNSNLIQKKDPLGNIWEFEYDKEDRLKKSIDPKGNFIAYEYDSIGRVNKTTDKRGNATTYTYDVMGNLKTQIDPYGNVLFVNTYDSKNRLIESINALNQKTTTTYDIFGKSEIKDPLGRITKLEYDNMGRVIKSIDAMDSEAEQQYNPDGSIKEFVDTSGNKTSFTYNKDGQLIKTQTASGSTEINNYDEYGRLEQFTNGRGQNKRISYDKLGRVEKIVDSDGVITYTYDDNSNLLTIKENNKQTAKYTYDKLNRVKSYQDSWGKTIYYSYDALSNLISITYPDGKVINLSYDANSNLIEVKDGTLKTKYTYDKNNRLIELTRPNGTKLTRSYYKDGKLKSQTDKASDGAIISEVSFEYYDNGTIKKETIQPEPKPLSPIDLSLSYSSGNLLSQAGNKTAIYDKDDNLVNLGNQTFSYDSRNRLTQADGTTYGYDSQNHRIWQKEGNKQTKYIINPNSSLSQLLQKIDPGGTTTNYIYGLGLIYQEQNGKRLYYHYDLRGSTIALTDQNGKVVDRWSYLPYGAKISHGLGNTKTLFLYNGRDGVQTDSNGLYYMRARYYHPTIRRFINRDTLLGEIGNLPALNRFAYVNGDPVSGVDPSGLTPKEDENMNEYFKNMNEYFNDRLKDKLIKNLLKSDAKVWGNASKKQWRISARKTHLFLRKNYDRVEASVEVFKKSYEASTIHQEFMNTLYMKNKTFFPYMGEHYKRVSCGQTIAVAEGFKTVVGINGYINTKEICYPKWFSNPSLQSLDSCAYNNGYPYVQQHIK